MAKKRVSKFAKKRGTQRMRENGMVRVEVWLDKNEHALIVQAADIIGRKLATFVREAAFGSAAVVVQKDAGHQHANAVQWEEMIQLEQRK